MKDGEEAKDAVDAHLERVEEAIWAQREDGATRGYRSQRRKREVESATRRRVVEEVRFLVIEGGKKAEIAEGIGIPARTLRFWEKLETEGLLGAKRRGRPLKRSSVEDRNRLIHTIEEHGPQIGVRMLRSIFPDLSKGEIRDVLMRYRAHYIREHALVLEALEWTTPGLVWAMDHTEPPAPVDGKNRTVLAVRDLASGAQILWKEELGPRAAEVVRDLEGKFLLHGPPLVLKVDNGSAFIAQELKDLCRRSGVELLWSPPRMPRYNGSIESSIRWMKERTEHVARRAGRRGEWRHEDLEVALELTNALPKEAGTTRTSRGDVLRAQRRITDAERQAFRRRLEEERAAERRARGIPPEAKLARREEAEINRNAMRRALVALGILNIQKRRVSLTLNSILAANIS